MKRKVELDLNQGHLFLQAALESVDEHAEPDWREAALEALRLCALQHEDFIVDDVWGFMPEGVETHENRAMGAVILKGVKRGWVEKTDQYRPSAQPQCHKNPRRVWRSKLFSRPSGQTRDLARRP